MRAAEQFQANYDGFTHVEQQQYLQTHAAKCVQSSAPVSYGNCSKKCRNLGTIHYFIKIFLKCFLLFVFPTQKLPVSKEMGQREMSTF